jgi:hypothetical protein
MVMLENGKAYIGKGGSERAKSSARRVSREQNSIVSDVAHWSARTDASAFRKEAEMIDWVGGVGTDGLLNKINSPGKKS